MCLFSNISFSHKGGRLLGGKPLGDGGVHTGRANTNRHLIRCHRCHWLRRRPPKHSRGSTAGAPARKKKVTPVCEQRHGAGASLVPAVRRAPRWWHLPWPDAPVPRGPKAARDRRPGGRTGTGGRTPWSGAKLVAAGGAHCPQGQRSPRCEARCESPPPLTCPGVYEPPPCSGRAGLRRFGVHRAPRVGTVAPVAGKLCR